MTATRTFGAERLLIVDEADLFGSVRRKVDATGHGLGLALVGQFIELQRGQVWVADRIGGGAVFAVQLPGAVPIPR